MSRYAQQTALSNPSSATSNESVKNIGKDPSRIRGQREPQYRFGAAHPGNAVNVGVCLMRSLSSWQEETITAWPDIDSTFTIRAALDGSMQACWLVHCDVVCELREKVVDCAERIGIAGAYAADLSAQKEVASAALEVLEAYLEALESHMQGIRKAIEAFDVSAS